MEIWTLLKANIRKKKGTFLSIILLMIIVATSMTAIFSVGDNYDKAQERAFKEADAGNITLIIQPGALTETLRSDVENSSLVERVSYYPAIEASGAAVGRVRDGNPHYFMEMRDGIHLYNEKLDGFADHIPDLEAGEIYLPLGLRNKLKCETGDIVNYHSLDREYKFKIKGFVQEPVMGAATIGWTQVFVSSEDFRHILAYSRDFENAGTGEGCAEMIMMMIYQSSNSLLSDAKFQRQLELETKIIANSMGALTKMQSVRYTGLFFEIVTYVMVVFVGLLFVIILIVTSHSISTEIEMDYVNFGILKSLGFTQGKIRVMIAIQYLLAEVIGIAAGNFAAVLLERTLSRILMQNTAILPDNGISVGRSIVTSMFILAVSLVVIFIKTNHIAKVSPVRAISGGREEIYFESRLNMPISKKGLSASLALRQFTSGMKRYISTIVIVMILTFFMLTVNLTANLLDSKTALEAMGMNVSEIDITSKGESLEKYIDDIEQTVESYSPVLKKYYENGGYMSLNGENLRFDCYMEPQYINAVLKGRAPLYGNEIIITEMIAELLDIGMGDEVTASHKEKEDKYIVSGIYQSGNDSGMNFAMSFEGAKKLGIDTISYMGFVLEEPEKSKEIADALNKEFSDVLTARTYDPKKDGLGDGIGISVVVNALKMVIYGFSVLFALVVVRMVCSKAFHKERIDIGIYKAVGFTTAKLRLQFAVRFLVIALLGGILGTALSAAFSARLLGMILKNAGLSQIHTDYTPETVLIPIAAVSLCFFLFAYLVSRRIKNVAVRELVTE